MKGFVIPIAWPETYCKQAGAWYDGITRITGFNKYNYYRAGHAALVIVHPENGLCHYFDFGRYHTPFSYGRARCAETDYDLIIKTKAVFDKKAKKIENIEEILMELQNNPSCHGEGGLHASYGRINFEKAFAKAIGFVENSPLPYGPFVQDGTNCSRFVNFILRKGRVGFFRAIRLRFYKPFSPTPLNNVHAFKNQIIVPKQLEGDVFVPVCKLSKERKENVLPAPERERNIPQKAHWLSGEGCGSWFYPEIQGSFLHVTQFSPKGIIESSAMFEPNSGLPTSLEGYKVTYMSHGKKVTLTDGQDVISFYRVIKKLSNS